MSHSEADNQSAGVDGAASSQQDLETSMDELVAQATAKYAQKEYSEAADLYSRATELQAQINGELSPLNADLLFCYGRCLYQVALLNSDILGSKIAKEANQGNELSSGQQKAVTANEGTSGGSRSVSRPEEADVKPAGPPTSLQFVGDEEYGASDDEDGDANGAEAADQEDEFSNAFEILDLARVLFLKRLQDISGSPEQGTLERRMQERLADTFDLQAEISLEGEQFADAAKDLEAALDLKIKLYPSHSNLVAETQYKLSLALEFASVPSPQPESDDPSPAERKGPDEATRKEAAEHMKAAIDCCELRIHREEEAIAKAGADETRNIRKSIKEVKEMVDDMQQRLADLQQPFKLPSKDELESGAVDGTAIRGILSTFMDKSPEAQKAQLEQVSDQARDLTGLVKRKKPDSRVDQNQSEQVQKPKRKVDSSDDFSLSNAAKRAKPEDGAPDEHGS